MEKIITYSSLAIGIISVILTILFYFKSKRLRRINFIKTNIHILKKPYNFQFLDIQYKSKKIENLNITKLMILNSGRETINNSDITRIQPLKIEFPPFTEIYENSIFLMNNLANGFSLNNKECEIEIHFDYMDPGDFVIIQLIHNLEESAYIRITGKMKATQISEIKFEQIKRFKFYLLIIYFLIFFLTFFFVGIITKAIHIQLLFSFLPYYLVMLLLLFYFRKRISDLNAFSKFFIKI
jgi:hypothetical protein